MYNNLVRYGGGYWNGGYRRGGHCGGYPGIVGCDHRFNYGLYPVMPMPGLINYNYGFIPNPYYINGWGF